MVKIWNLTFKIIEYDENVFLQENNLAEFLEKWTFCVNYLFSLSQGSFNFKYLNLLNSNSKRALRDIAHTTTYVKGNDCLKN